MATLPELFSAWSHEQPWRLDGVRPHHQAAVEVAFAQFAAHALDVSKQELHPRSAPEWRALLEALAEKEGAPTFWELVVEGADKVAFMQPVLVGKPGTLKIVTKVVDFDVITRSKNHDLKQDELLYPSVWDWCCVLITLQTTTNYSGKYLQPVFRMNGGSGSRMFAAAYNDDTPHGRWAEDVRRLPPYWREVCEKGLLGFKDSGTRLLASRSWDVNGAAGIQLSELHPGTVEVARAVRLALVDGVLVAHQWTSIAPRVYVGDKSSKTTPTTQGAVEDPWTPIVWDEDTKAMKGVTARGTGGLNSRAMLHLAMGTRYTPSPFTTRVDPSREVTFVLRVHAKKDTESAAYQEYRHTFPARVAPWLFGPRPPIDERAAFLDLCAALEDRASQVTSRAAWAYQTAQVPLESQPDATTSIEAIKKVLERTAHKKLVTAMQNRLDARWHQALLPFVCGNTGTPEELLSLWTKDCLGRAEKAVTEILAPNKGQYRTSALQMAKALNVLKTFRPTVQTPQ